MNDFVDKIFYRHMETFPELCVNNVLLPFFEDNKEFLKSEDRMS
jgi:hypothetical protein